MNRNDELKIELISSIKDEIIDKQTKKRIELSEKPHKKSFGKSPFMRYGALAAAFLLVLVSVTAIVMMNRDSTPEKQIPVYQGMTVSSTAPTQEELKNAYFVDLSAQGIVNLSGESEPAETYPQASKDENKNKDKDKNKDKKFEDALKQDMLSVSTAAMYYAKPGEDIYINIYLSNPDDFEIISFTLNDVTYQSFMFEDGSNLEHLILKYNVGAATGIVEYTLDAIKYIDGTVIKDVLLNANKTVKVAITPASPETLITTETVGFDSLELSASLSEISSLIAANGFKTYAVLFDGEDIISKTELTSTEQNVKFDSLKPDTEYRYALVASHGDGEESSSVEILYSKDFVTKSPISIENIGIEAMDVVFSITWADDYNGEKALTSLSLYEGETLVRELLVTDTKIEGLPFDRTYSLVAKYIFKNTEYTYSIAISSPRSSVGLAVSGGVVTGIGSCSDTVLYIDMPIGDRAFFEHKYIQKVYFGSGVTSIGETAFFGCSGLCEIVFPENGLSLGNEAFSCCINLESVHITSDVGYGSFSGCEKLKKVTFTENVENIGASAFSGCSALAEITLPKAVTKINDGTFIECNSLKYIDLSNITEIGINAFSGCNQLANVIINESRLAHVGTHAFADCHPATEYENGKYFGTASNPYLILAGHSAFTGDVKIHKDTKFMSFSFDARMITSIELPDALVEIPEAAFMTCADLESIVIPASVKKIGESAFDGCVGLKTVTFKSNTELTISNCAFIGCPRLKNVIFENDTKLIIGPDAFAYCTALKSIILPEGIVSIASYAFNDCSDLTVYVRAESIPEGTDEWMTDVKEVIWGYKGE